ncbi:MAG TPA: AAA family ATPase [Thermomicrobiales bacterium]|jgi:DNA-binding CsgD family transcriptional regulator/tetratricopeptide (TPR) repeat protein|nr:AAA family ATPase [Thermomicrobiales bacterium]
MVLLERDDHLAALERALGEAAAGRGSLLFVGGETGVGKTALVERFRQGVRHPVRVFTGACDSLSTPRPLAPVADIAVAMGGELARSLTTHVERGGIFQAFLAAVSVAGSPAVVVFEDVHWADEATLDLLRFFGRRVGAAPVLLIATYRDDEAGPTHPLRIVLGDLATAGTVRRISLSRLSPDAVRLLAEGTPFDPVALHRATGGNPFFVTEVLASGAEMPATVRDAVLSRAARLSPGGRLALDAAAVIGARAEVRLLATILTGPEGTDECVATGMLYPAGETVAFRHDLARAAILGAISPARALRLQRRVLEALRLDAVTSADLARLTHHAEAAGDSTAVVMYGQEAARHAARLGAHRQAAEQYARVLRFAVGLDPLARADLLDAYATECARVDRQDDAIAARHEALGIYRATGSRLREGATLAHLAQLLIWAGRNAEAEEAITTAVEILERLPPVAELVLAYRIRAALRMLDRDTAAAVFWGERVLALASELGTSADIAMAQNVIGSALLVTGDERGVWHLKECLRLARADGQDDLVALGLSNLGSALGEQYQFARAVPYLDEAIHYCTERDLDRLRLYSLAWRALSALHQGRWDDAAADADIVLAWPGSATISRVMALVALGRLRARRGDPGAADVLDEALALAAPSATLQRLGPVHAARAEMAWLAGDRERASVEARAAFAMAARHDHAWYLGELAAWRWRVGDLDAPPAGVAEPFAREMAGDAAGAAACWEALGCPYEAARALAASDDEGDLRKSLEELGHLGARPLAHVVRRRLRERGVRNLARGPRPLTRANPAGLTAREVEIVGLIADGLRNAEIAERLFLSPRTVEHHLTTIFGKLEARSRTEAVREATRLGLLC